MSNPSDNMSNEQIISRSIRRSISHNEIVHCTVSDVANNEIHGLVTEREWDYSDENRDGEGREVLDVYALDGKWRIKVTFA